MTDPTDRGRVPFAVVGVLLLVSASTLVATSRYPARPTAEPAAERAIERAERAVVSALRRATAEAARESVAHPLTAPADTPAGRVLDTSDPFRAALELRLSRSLRERLQHVSLRTGDVSVVARLPARPAGEAASVRAALGRVDTERAGPNATGVRATVRNVTLVVTRLGRTLDTVRLSPSVVVGVPAFALHDRMVEFERRLNRGPLESGFGRRLTARLYAAAWARGTAQYGGAPVVNVLGTRHVELLANGALLATQRSTLGGVDPDATLALDEATGRVAVADVASGIREGLTRSNRTATAGLLRASAQRPAADRRHVVPVGAAANRALSNLTGGGLDRVLARTYTATTRTRATVDRRSRTVEGGGRPGPEWSLADRRGDTSWSTRALDSAVGPPESVSGWHRLATTTRLVVRTRTERARWERGNRTRWTDRTVETTFAVGLVHEGRPSRETTAPARPVRRAFDRAASPVGGPNLADAADVARVRFEERADRLAVRSVRGETNETNRIVDGSSRITGRVPAELHDRAATDLVSVHRRVRNVSVSVERGALATLSTAPARRLASQLRARRPALVGAPERYASVAERARVAVRAAYVDAVVAALEEQAARHGRAEDQLDAVLRERGLGGLDRLRRLAATRPPRAGIRPSEVRGRFGPVRTGVSTAPVYLSTTADADGQPPLATRNVNLAAPYADATDTVTGVVSEVLPGGERVRLGRAARTLRSARQAGAATGDENRTDGTRRLGRAVNTSVDRVTDRLERTLRRRGVGRETSRAAVAEGLDRWDTPTGRALALSNGSVAPRVVAAVARRAPRFRESPRRVALRASLNSTLDRALRSERVRVPAEHVDRTGRRLRWLARTGSREVTQRTLKAGMRRLRGRLRGPLSAVPAGIPVTPVPGYWYATTNVWHVEVRGRYERVTLRARTGRPPTGTLTYVRDGSPVRLDVDGDGSPERLGRAAKVSFDASTAVVVAVPPGPRGVGDKDGNADERSDGWPGPPTESDARFAAANETTYRPPS